MDGHNCSSTSAAETDATDDVGVDKQSKKLKTEKLNLTLENFDGDDIPDDYPYVLTSPRSLAACKHFGVRVSSSREY
jgi:hypothetical protein